MAHVSANERSYDGRSVDDTGGTDLCSIRRRSGPDVVRPGTSDLTLRLNPSCESFGQPCGLSPYEATVSDTEAHQSNPFPPGAPRRVGRALHRGLWLASREAVRRDRSVEARNPFDGLRAVRPNTRSGRRT